MEWERRLLFQIQNQGIVRDYVTYDAQQNQEGCFQVCIEFREPDMTVMSLTAGCMLLDIQSLFLLTPAGTVVQKLVIVAGLRVNAPGTRV